MIEIALESRSEADTASFGKLCDDVQQALAHHFGDRMLVREIDGPFPKEGHELQEGASD